MTTEVERAAPLFPTLLVKAKPMKRNVILLVDGDADLSSIVLVAAADQALDVRLARSARCSFGMCNSPLDDVATIIIDLDSGLQTVGLLAALEREAQTPPVIAITGSEEAYLREVALAHGATTCLSKPVSRAELRNAIVQATRKAEEMSGCRCDVWGHPHLDCTCAPARSQIAAHLALAL